MRAAVIFALAAVALAGSVLELDPKNFDTELSADGVDITLVKFFAPWCGHCKAMASDYEAAATQLKASHPNIRLAEVDCDQHGDLARRFDVKGYPTLKVFRRGDLENPEDYNGPRTIDGLVKTIVKAGRPALNKVDSVEALDKAVAEATAAGDLVVSAVLPSDKELETFSKFATKAAKSFTVYTTTGSERRIQVHLPGEDAVSYTDSKMTVSKLSAWAEANKFPLYGEINQDNFKGYLERGVPLAWVFVDPSAPSTKQVAESILSVAKDVKGKVTFVHLDGTMYGGMAQRLGLEGKAFPSIAIDIEKTKQHFVLSPEGSVPSAEELGKWVNDVLEGNVEATIRSAPEPESQPGDDDVFVLTGKNFKASTVDSGLDVLVEFYAPWCSHCKALAPEFSGLARATSKSKGLRIAKLDATANDIPVAGFDVKGYPTLYFIKAGANGAEPSIVPYTGGRTKADMLTFLKNTATNEVVVEE